LVVSKAAPPNGVVGNVPATPDNPEPSPKNDPVNPALAVTASRAAAEPDTITFFQDAISVYFISLFSI
jgi:hypothetical protein